MVNRKIDSDNNGTDTQGHIRIQPDNKGRTIDDTEAHLVRGRGAVEDADTEGHVLRAGKVEDADTEGHAARKGFVEDADTEGHAAKFKP